MHKPALLWTPQAREDLLEIYVSIGIDNPPAAERMFTAIEQCVDLLKSSPRIGVRRPEIAPRARVLIEAPYLVLYELEPDIQQDPVRKIEIVRIVHGHRDLTRLFQ